MLCTASCEFRVGLAASGIDWTVLSVSVLVPFSSCLKSFKPHICPLSQLNHLIALWIVDMIIHYINIYTERCISMHQFDDRNVSSMCLETTAEQLQTETLQQCFLE